MFYRRQVLGLLAAAPFARPAAAYVRTEVFLFDGLALRGYDPVGYFTENRPVEGTPDHSLMWRGAEWRFASAESMESFEMHPEAYAPQYGGYCAYALSLGKIAPTAPEAWTIFEDRLYMNFSTEVRTIWSEDIPGNIAKADAHWPQALDS
jgi:YHS domain-containing protein